MKVIGLLFCFWVFSFSAHAGFKVKNGGAVVVCENADPGNRSVELLEFFELRTDGKQLKFDSSKELWLEKLESKLLEWHQVAPYRMLQYLTWARSFQEEAAFLPDIKIETIHDFGAIFMPASCGVQTATLQRAEQEIFPGDKRYVVNQQLWNAMDEEQKAGLVLHELIYREAIPLKHQNSVPTRKLTALLSSSEVNTEAYFQVVARMPLPYIEYNGANVSGASCGGFVSSSEVCSQQPEVRFYDSGALRYLRVAGNYKDRVELPGLVFDEVSSMGGSIFEWREDGTLQTSLMRWSLQRLQLVLTASERSPLKYQMIYDCDTRKIGTKNSCVDFYLDESRRRYQVRSLRLAHFYDEEPVTEKILFKSENGHLQFLLPKIEMIEILDRVDFSIRDLKKRCSSLSKIQLDPALSWFKLEGVGVVSGITSISSSCEQGQWSQIDTLSGSWKRAGSAWVLQK